MYTSGEGQVVGMTWWQVALALGAVLVMVALMPSARRR